MPTPCTDRFRTGLASSHTMLVKTEVLRDGVVVQEIIGDTVIDDAGSTVSIVGGSVEVDRAVVRRRCTVEFLDVDRALMPTSAADLLAPLRTEIRLWRGMIYPDATYADAAAGTDREYIPIGTFVVAGLTQDYPKVTVTGYDRMWLMTRAKAVVPYTIAASTNLVSAIQDLILATVPASRVTFDATTTDQTSGLTVYDEQTDLGQAAHDLAAAAGLALYCDPMGVFTLVPETDDSTPASLTWTEGPGGVVLRPHRELDATDAENAVVATGEATDVTGPARGYAEDTNPRSLTYAKEVGVIPRFYSSPLLRTDAQAELAAATILARELGVSDVVAVPLVPDPTLEGGDVALVDTDDLTRTVILDSFSVPLRADGQQTVACRTQPTRLL